ncbi:hypothetical protein H6G33_07525 [Calothrix sp. FACHB-1219]|uniref:hypothetical protein n=1 Tax=unclassified Calothrix TaxID=2619626 RepID=UPI0016859EC4|nr:MULTISPECIES: hypothetical protein [unclassified Calothrix]MBD2204611.1 hypothetical protein [Calothrix sp. FACHB-168]MBD2216877.1 hypothetical protein [Calothrix sp. FACHB-1219]
MLALQIYWVFKKLDVPCLPSLPFPYFGRIPIALCVLQIGNLGNGVGRLAHEKMERSPAITLFTFYADYGDSLAV